MIDTWNPAVLNETTQAIDSWNPAELNQVTTKVDSWNPAILNKNLESTTPVVFSATITASFPEGATCTATDGTTTLTADDNPMAFSIPNEGTWTVACVANGVTLSEDVVITTNGQTETVDLTPVGATVTPTDSVPMLIACAGIGDSEITTIAGALADVETLTAILESENAVDYLVRSTTFASDVTSDSVAMTGIGAINYDANTLLDNSTWRSAICNSTYFESVLNAKVPTMTSNTVPSGEVIFSSEGNTYKGYKAFDGDDSTQWAPNATGSAWVGYVFTDNVKVCKCEFIPRPQYSNDNQVSYSEDGITWNNGSSVVSAPSTGSTRTKYTTLVNATKCKYYRITGSNSQAAINYFTVQFYGRVDV